jgi:NAD(P)-dependent dehydrogenase (short-subunit alcohol dehydrogenase family)
VSARVDHFDLGGRRAVVFGSESAAGRAIVAAFREADARLREVAAVRAEQAAAAVETAAAELGGLDVFACATDAFVARPFAETTLEDVAGTMMRNFATPFCAAQAAVRRLLAQGAGGNIVFVTSVLGARGLPNCAAYCAAHGALQNLVRALAQEVAPHAISVNAIELGWMDWMQDRLDPADAEAARALRFTLSKRAGTAEDVGPLAVWLSGSGAGYVSGQMFPLDGGLTQHL